ncbi:MAG: hypothetical protein F4239_05440 [Gammaproteobacteria bacterium]|nr:hypothetical protein [Gammaproteobacteria bacterium]MYI88768.1 hypothetical protein [Gammaproteobacteria bacterium]
MLTKILFTIAVIVVVLLVYQARFRPVSQAVQKAKHNTAFPNKPSKWVVYTVAGILAVSSGIVYFFKWQSDNTILTIRVINAQQEEPFSYKARQKDIKGRTFTTLDGRVVTLGASDRIELIDD